MENDRNRNSVYKILAAIGALVIAGMLAGVSVEIVAASVVVLGVVLGLASMAKNDDDEPRGGILQPIRIKSESVRRRQNRR